MDIRGTAFQHRVWTALATIPSGEPLSYRELAVRIGAQRGFDREEVPRKWLENERL